jgi:hypothetical protein
MILTVTEQITLIHKRFPINAQRGTIGKVTIRSLIQSHPLHQGRFNNPARRSDAPTGITETERKLLEINSLKIKRKQRKIKNRCSEKEFTIQISTSAKKQIALQYTRLKGYTSRYRKKRRQKFKYPAETTANAVKIPRQMPLFIKTISDNK